MVFSVGEWYHCFNRGVDKRQIFDNEYDADRFLMLLYLANDKESINLFSIRRPRLRDILKNRRGIPNVAIGAYCLMPNHYHILLKEIVDGGITSFMRKIGTAYTMYFNSKHERVGHLFTGTFRARHVVDDRYFQKVLPYIHCNPAELYEPGWRSGKVRNMNALEGKLVEYPYSSMRSYVRKSADPIISRDAFDIAYEQSISRMLGEARADYAENTL